MDIARKLENYTIDDIYALPDGVRAELIDGQIYYMVTPTRTVEPTKELIMVYQFERKTMEQYSIYQLEYMKDFR